MQLVGVWPDIFKSKNSSKCKVFSFSSFTCLVRSGCSTPDVPNLFEPVFVFIKIKLINLTEPNKLYYV